MDERLRNGMVPSADRVPTLTEVLDLDEALQAASEAPQVVTERAAALVGGLSGPWQGPSTEAAQAAASAAAAMPTPAPVDEDTLVARVVEALLPSLDVLLQERLFEALAPALERAAQQIVQDTRAQLAETLHQCVQETVAQLLQTARVDP